jgi:hypothetical protein
MGSSPTRRKHENLKNLLKHCDGSSHFFSLSKISSIFAPAAHGMVLDWQKPSNDLDSGGRIGAFSGYENF